MQKELGVYTVNADAACTQYICDFPPTHVTRFLFYPFQNKTIYVI